MYEKSESRIASVIYSIHFYVAIALGWMLYHQEILPVSLAQRFMEPAKYDQVRIYLLHLMAFSALVYVVTRPFARLVSELITAIVTAICGLFQCRRNA